jgi:hypothetical protein
VKTYVKYYAALVALYIGVAHGTDAGNLFSKVASGGAEFTRALQGQTK